MTPQTGQQVIRTHIWPNISRHKGNKAIKLTQLKNITWDILFLKNHTEKEAERLLSNHSLFF